MTALQQRGSDYFHCALLAGQEVRLCSADVHPDRALQRRTVCDARSLPMHPVTFGVAKAYRLTFAGGAL